MANEACACGVKNCRATIDWGEYQSTNDGKTWGSASDCSGQRYEYDQHTVPKLRAALQEALDMADIGKPMSPPQHAARLDRIDELRKLVTP